MIDDIINAVAEKISENFNDIKIYDEIIKQGFEAPCFCISAISVEDNLFRGERYKYCAYIEIRYYSKSERDKASVGEKLYRCLEYISSKNTGIVRGGSMRGELCEDYFKFNVNYEFYYIRSEEKDVMGSVRLELKF